MSSTREPGWRRLDWTEHFEYDYTPDPGLERGYCISICVFLNGHSSDGCGCRRCRGPEVVRFFFPHINEIHGVFPMQSTEEGWMREKLHQHLNELQIGRIDGNTPRNISYGYLSSGDRREEFMRRLLRLGFSEFLGQEHRSIHGD